MTGPTMVKIITAAPSMVNLAMKLLDALKKPAGPGSAQDLSGLQNRLDGVESHMEAQTELIAQMAQNHEGLMAQMAKRYDALSRANFLLTLALLVVTGIAIAGLVIALMR